MKRSSLFAFASLLLGTALAPAAHSADLPPVGTPDRLAYDAIELNRLTQQTWLKVETKQFAQRYSAAAGQLLNCIQTSQLAGCGIQLQQLQTAWLPLERKLNDTMYEYAQVYRQYVDARRSLHGLQGAPKTSPSAFSVTGTLDGLAFYFMDTLQTSIADSCREFLTSQGINAVQSIVIGGSTVQTGQFSVSANQACLVVGNSATRLD